MRPDGLADVLDLNGLPVVVAQVHGKSAVEQLKKPLETRLGDGWVIPVLGKLVADKRVLRLDDLAAVSAVRTKCLFLSHLLCVGLHPLPEIIVFLPGL